MTETRTIEVRNPRTGEHDYRFGAPSGAALRDAVAALRSAQPVWLAGGVERRIDALRRWQQALKQHETEIVAALAVDTGRRLLAAGEFAGLNAMIERWCHDAPALLEPKHQPAKALPDVLIEQTADPYPVLGAISPWNFPLLLSFIDALPALLAGSAVLIKPSEVTPRFAAPVLESIRAVPELAAVVGIVPGDGVTGRELIDLVDIVAFTGSVATGRKVAVAAAEAFVPAYLELGGKDPAIVLEGSDLERAATSVLRASVSATGQACQSIERIYVHRSCYDEFVALLTKKAGAAALSWPDPGKGIVGPLIFARQAEIIDAHLKDAVAKGARVHIGGTIDRHGGGAWIAPTVLSGVNHDMLVMRDETFGPLMPVMAFDDVDEAVRLANDTTFGLSAAVFGPDERAARDVAVRLNAGGISVNDAGLTTMLFETEKCAFGYSGLGPSRVGPSGLTRFLRRKSIYLNRGEVRPVQAFDEALLPGAGS